ncbi:MAG: prepilin-type N-terminal cleavage/methylation domain-containing protein [Verrucomicrobiae bacterium]
MRKSSAFTLIELLIVIAIIGILMSLLFPAVNGAIDAARKAQAKNDVTQIATAVIAYETEYGKLPTSPTSDATMDAKAAAAGDIISILANMNSPTNDNPRRIVFLEVQTAKKGKSGIGTNGSFVDPWGGTYQIRLDGDYDNTFSNVSVPSLTSDGGSDSVTVRKKVMLWNTNSSYRKRVRSWE